ncbi:MULTISPECIES: hypothetical protein [Pseudomonas]|uniref:hypothetical protein n=1 Tax=Pseudomonas TaxID=286 RepID=UPI0019092B14|nr:MULTISPECIES: hypothetical protein [Pseudomonas]MBK3476432.1 hypothetical protein [Pseudomonas sp. MF6751]MBL4980923.1 hypothetical protein [Pseudomonas fluorescens]
MNLDEQVISAIFEELFEDNSSNYKRELSKPVDSNADLYSRVRCALAKLSVSERDDIFRIFDIIVADSASVIFGTLDGTHFPNNINEDFTLKYNNKEIQGNLQDIFIEKAEVKGVYK